MAASPTACALPQRRVTHQLGIRDGRFAHVWCWYGVIKEGQRLLQRVEQGGDVRIGRRAASQHRGMLMGVH